MKGKVIWERVTFGLDLSFPEGCVTFIRVNPTNVTLFINIADDGQSANGQSRGR